MTKDWIGNKRTVFSILGASNHSETDRQSEDYYATSPLAIDKLASKFEIPKRVLEPCCGEGHLSERLKELGHEVWSYDIVDRGYGEVQNFFEMLTLPDSLSLSAESAFREDMAVVTNPPYAHALEFIQHSLELVPDDSYVCMFVKTTFLEGKRRYKELFSRQPPMLVLQFVERILCAKNGDFVEARKQGSAVSYCWCIWRKNYKGKTIIDWI